ncbi:MAG TPA: hypothetical protein EYG38_03380 [Verrucomicrobia bacterium]|nr:hypothetical protein [Verrucomicrobiota bacterium]
MKSKSEKDQVVDARLLELLEKVLPKATNDEKLANRIFKAIQGELKLKNRRISFDKLCKRCELPDLEDKSVEAVRVQLESTFDKANVTLKPIEEENCLKVEVALLDGETFTSMIRTGPVVEISEEEEITLKFVPFPVSMPGDRELIWMLAKHETLTPDEAGRGLARAEEDFWASKTGQRLIRKHVERSFPEFVARVPAGLLRERGLKRHYKNPEPVKILHPSLKPSGVKTNP